MKILHLIDTAGPGGAETVFLNLVCRMKRAGHECLAVLPREDWLSDRLQEEGVEYLVLPSKGSLRFDLVWALRRLIKDRKIDLVHAHLLGSATYAGLATLFTDVPVVATFHGPTDLKDARRFIRLRRAILVRGLDKIVAVSDGTADALRDYGIPGDKIQVIGNGIDTDYFVPSPQDMLRREWGLDAQAAIVGSVGNIRPAKDYGTLLRAAAIVVQHRPDVVFAVAGQGTERQFADLISLQKELGLESTVRFLGQRTAGPDLYGNFDLFVSSSHSEGLPLSFLEAMACGRPLVATSTAGAIEVLERGEFGSLVPVKDHEALARAIIAGLESGEAEKQLLAQRGRRHIVERYSLKKMVGAYDALYQGLLAARSTAIQ